MLSLLIVFSKTNVAAYLTVITQVSYHVLFCKVTDHDGQCAHRPI